MSATTPPLQLAAQVGSLFGAQNAVGITLVEHVASQASPTAGPHNNGTRLAPVAPHVPALLAQTPHDPAVLAAAVIEHLVYQVVSLRQCLATQAALIEHNN